MSEDYRRRCRMRRSSVWFILSGAMVLLLIVAQAPVGRVAGEDVKFGEYTISGPHTHENLSVFLIRGQNKIEGKEFLTLQEAIDRKVAVVHETGDVGELFIDNKHPKIYIYIQQGDIVKGGKQDRVISFDVVVPPKTERLSLKSFCVEQGRWSKRGNESLAVFSTSNKQVVGKKLKALSNISAGTQSQVWNGVADLQNDLTDNVSVHIGALKSATSLQLTLEAGKVEKAAKAYVKALSRTIRGKRGVVGLAFAINGKVHSANIYASNVLSEKLWPKLLESSAVEAVAEIKKGKKFRAATGKDVKVSLSDAEKGKKTKKTVDAQFRVIKLETDKIYMFQTEDAKAAEEWVHRGYIAK
jgi:hypothetical protein